MRRTPTYTQDAPASWVPLGADPSRGEIAQRAAFIREKSRGGREPLRFTLAGGNRREGMVAALETDGVRVRGELVPYTQIVSVERALLPAAEPPEPIMLCCPNCGSENVGENDVIQATARGCWVIGDNGEPEFDAAGDTDVCWDSQEAVEDAPCFCTNCCWAGKPDELKRPDADDDELPEKLLDLADALEREGWISVAEDVRAGVSLTKVLVHLHGIDEGGSLAAGMVAEAIDV